MDPFPEPPADLPEDQFAEATLSLRYEDVAQDGRMKPDGLPHAMGATCWRGVLMAHPISDLTREHGILPILTRFVVEAGGGPVSVHASVSARGYFDLARAPRKSGADRLLMLLGTEVEGRASRTHGPPPENAGERVPLGRVFAEHVFTRPFASRREDRRVDAFPEGSGMPDIARVHPHRPVEQLLGLPEGAAPLDERAAPHAAPVVFGLGDTDSNAHVNSLVYPKRFEQATVARLFERGITEPLFTHRLEVAFRKPCFAGERLRIDVQTFREGDDAWGACCALIHPDETRPRCAGRLWLRR